MITNQAKRALLAVLLLGQIAHAELPPEDLGISEVLPTQLPEHYVWVMDSASFSRALLLDGDTGEMKGQLDTGYWAGSLTTSADRKSIYVNETYFSRGSRGTRQDIVQVYDAATLTAQREILVPPRRMTSLTMRHMTGITDNQRILGITNFTPMRSLSLVDLTSGQLLSEEETPGCGQVYPAGDNRLMTLCGDGSFLTFTIETGEDGQSTVHRAQSDPFFDPDTDPVIIPAGRQGDRWFYASFDGYFHEVDASTDTPVLAEKWSLLTDKERNKEWRTSGFQSLASHEKSGLLYTLMHQGSEDTYEEPGDEIWIYDSQSRERVKKIELEHPSLMIAVSTDDAPLLYASGYATTIPTWMLYFLGMTGGLGDIMDHLTPVLDVYDAHSGEHLRTIRSIGAFPSQLNVP